jgi:hypothetical protein
MGINWKDIHFGNSPITNEIFIGKSKPMKNNPGLSIWTDKSKDVAEECMYAVCCNLKQIQKDNGKAYAGYKYEDGSRIVWIAPGHEIEIK